MLACCTGISFASEFEMKRLRVKAIHPLKLQVKKMDQQHKERMRINAVVKELELEMAEQDYQNEKRNAAKEFEEKKV